MTPLNKFWFLAFLGCSIAFYYNCMYIDDRSRGKLKESYDYIIVGGGTAGSVLGNRLSVDDDITVAILEAGGAADDDPRVTTPYYFPSIQGTELDWKFYTTRQQHALFAMKNQVGYLPRGKLLGGSSNLNAMAYNRGGRLMYDMWAAEGCDGWSYDDVLPYFLKSEDNQMSSLKNSIYHSRGGPLPISEVKVTPLADLYAEAWKEIGNKVIPDNSGPNVAGFCTMQANIKHGQRYSTSRAFLLPVIHRLNLDVHTQNHVTKVVIEDGQAVGVEVVHHGELRTVRANKEVILSAGSIQSPQLLMLSGIGPSEHLKEIGIPVVADLPVGENLRDHLMFAFRQLTNTSYSTTDEEAESLVERIRYHVLGNGPLSYGGPEGSAYFHSDSSKEISQPPDLQISFFSKSASTSEQNTGEFNFRDEVHNVLPDGKRSFSYGLILLQPKSKGTIRLRSKDPVDHPLIDPNYLAESEDLDTFVKGIRVCERLAGTSTMAAIGANVSDAFHPKLCKDHLPGSDEHWKCMVRHLASTLYHQASTCRMGSVEDPTTVVDSKLRVKGVAGLRVVDASVIRDLYSGSPHAQVIMIAEKASDIIRNMDTVQHLKRRSPIPCPLLTQDRLQWCNTRRGWNSRSWRRVHWSDESRFLLHVIDGRSRIWRPRGTAYYQHNIQPEIPFGGGSMMVRGCCSYDCKLDLVEVQGNFDGEKYQNQILQTEIVPHFDNHTLVSRPILMDDNARPHRAFAVKEYLQRNAIDTLPWLARNSDLNPIEYLWDILGRRVRAPESLVCKIWQNLHRLFGRNGITSPKSKSEDSSPV
ncbi:L-sorbose 1-dehydrogenase-like [Ylistrum balloti]|uniref:L-sorbose 1-dehydrogenase-like n=1 Tax=Ylistrum balloti TaxID=509963 RepID=UPI002905D73A|nr:L-sorbose 1-dehydrogenase-like [Ylistrum balloti]